VGDDGPVLIEIEIRAVFAVVTDQTALVLRQRFVIARCRLGCVLQAGAVTRFAMDVGELRRGLYIDKTVLLKTERMATYARRIERAVLGLQRR
jgi:hypothetical protein